MGFTSTNLSEKNFETVIYSFHYILFLAFVTPISHFQFPGANLRDLLS